jgi:ketosteroid isomerase-like protein
MAEANAEIVRRFYEAWTRDDLPGPIDLLDPEVEYVNPEGAIEPGTRRGLDEFTKANQKVLDAWDYWRCEIESLTEIDDKVVAVVHYRTRGRGSGVEIEGRESALWTLRDGKVTRYAWFHGVDDAAEAAHGA